MLTAMPLAAAACGGVIREGAPLWSGRASAIQRGTVPFEILRDRWHSGPAYRGRRAMLSSWSGWRPSYERSPIPYFSTRSSIDR